MLPSNINSQDVRSKYMAFSYYTRGSNDKTYPVKCISYYNHGSHFRKRLWSYSTNPILTIWWEKNPNIKSTRKELTDLKIVKYFERPINPDNKWHSSIPHDDKTWKQYKENSTTNGSRGHIHLRIRKEESVDESIDCLFSEFNLPKEVLDNFKESIFYFAKCPYADQLNYVNNDYAKSSLHPLFFK